MTPGGGAMVNPLCHVVPVGDLVAHDTDLDTECVCGPTLIDGHTIAVHHSLDGREATEPERGFPPA